jgi:large subunit ribosomal protein L31e
MEREYIIPLRRAWRNVPQYERTGKAIKAIKIFVAKHMKVQDRDVNNVKLDVYFNNEIWFRGRANPPAKIKVKVKKEGELVHVSFAETPKHVTHLKNKNAKLHKAAEKPVEKPSEEKKEDSRTEEQKTEEAEKEKSVAQAGMKEAKAQAKAEKHVTKVEKAQHPQRMALKK